MARYTAGECYKYTGTQERQLSDALLTIKSTHESIILQNTKRKTILEEKVDEIRSETQSLISFLAYSSFR